MAIETETKIYFSDPASTQAAGLPGALDFKSPPPTGKGQVCEVRMFWIQIATYMCAWIMEVSFSLMGNVSMQACFPEGIF